MSHRNHTRQRQQKNPAELPNMQAATCNYNRTVFAYLLAVTKKKNNLSQTALCALIMSTFGVVKAHAVYLITAVTMLRHYPTICAAIHKNGTIDIARLAIIGKHLTGLSKAQLKQMKPQLHALCTEQEWITPTSLRSMLIQARIKVDEKARQKAEAQARKRAQMRANKDKPVVMTELPSGVTELTLRIAKEQAVGFHRCITAAAAHTKQPVEKFLHDYMTRLADPPVTLLGATDHNGVLMIEGLGTFTVSNAADFQDVAAAIHHTSLAQLQALGLTPVASTAPTQADAPQGLLVSDSSTAGILDTPEMSKSSQEVPQVPEMPETPEASVKPVTPEPPKVPAGKASNTSVKQVA